MRINRVTPATVWIAALGMLTLLSWPLQAAEKREQTYVKTNFTTAYKTSVQIGDTPNHEVGQELLISDMTYSNPAFKVKGEWVFGHFDYIDGTGAQRGSFVDSHEDGSQTYGRYEGSQKTVMKPDGTWEATWEGTYQYTGGTGRYKNIKGSGTYKGKASSTEAAREEGREVVEY